MAGQASGNHGQNPTGSFGELLTPVGDWYVDEFVFVESSTEPNHFTGRVTSRSLIGGAAILAIFEIPDTGARFGMIVTYNPRSDLYELAIADANSDMGLGILVSKAQNRRAPPDVRHRFGKAATEIREWTVAEASASLGGTVTDVILAMLPVAAAAAGLTEGSSAEGISMRISEILVSTDRWLLQFFFITPQGESLAAEIVCTRIQPGSQPQFGSELGCPGLVGCASGCEGFQPSNGVPLGQAPGPVQVVASAPCGCTAQGQGLAVGAQVGCQTQLIGVSQECAQPMAVSPPVVVAPPLCAPVQPCAPGPCPRQPVPPPSQPPPRPPGKPGHSR